MDGKTFDPEAVAEGQKRMKKLFKEYVTYGMALKVPGVKQTLGIPDLPAAPKHLISAQTLSSIFRQQ
ncbi:hypothetical protein RYX36_002572 [Vicia faba]